MVEFFEKNYSNATNFINKCSYYGFRPKTLFIG